METKDINRNTVAFINDKSPIIDILCDNLITSGIQIVFRSENIAEGLSRLSLLKTLPDICIIDLDFSDKGIIKQLRELRSQYPTLKLIAHSDMDDEKILKQLFGLGFSKYVLIGEDIKKAIDGMVTG